MSKREIAQAIYNEMVTIGASKDDIINEFRTHPALSMTESGATTYYYNCKRAAAGGVFNVTAGTSTGGGRDKTPFDNSPDVEDTRPLYTVVTPGDSECGKFVCVSSTHSYFSAIDALSKVKFDQIVVEGLPEIGSDFDLLTPYQHTA